MPITDFDSQISKMNLQMELLHANIDSHAEEVNKNVVDQDIKIESLRQKMVKCYEWGDTFAKKTDIKGI